MAVSETENVHDVVYKIYRCFSQLKYFAKKFGEWIDQRTQAVN